MNIEEAIKIYCNPTNITVLSNIVSLFERLDYSKCDKEFLKVENEGDDSTSNELGFLIRTLIIKHAILIISESGITVNQENTKLQMYYNILEFISTIPYITTIESEFITGVLEYSIDDTESFINIMVAINHANIGELFTVIEDVDSKFIDIIEDHIIKLNDDIDTNNTSNILVRVLRDLTKDIRYDTIGLKSITSEDNTKDLEYYLKSYNDQIITTNITHTVYNIMSILILGNDSRFKRLEYYTSVIENYIDNETLSHTIYEKIIKLDVEVNELLTKYNLTS